MNWSKEEHVVLDQLRELPEFRLDKERQFQIFENVRKRIRPQKKRRRMYAVAACAMVAVVLTVGVVGSNLLPQGHGSLRSGTGEPGVVFQLQAPDGETVTQEGLKATMRALQQRLDVMGIENAQLETMGSDEIRVQVDSTIDWDLVKKSLERSAKLEFKAPDGTVLLNGNDLKSNAIVLHDTIGQKMVSLEFKDAVKLKEISESYRGQKLSIWLDDSLIQEPTISEVITDGRVVMNTETPEQLANLLNAGTLPYPLKEVVPN